MDNPFCNKTRNCLKSTTTKWRALYHLPITSSNVPDLSLPVLEFWSISIKTLQSFISSLVFHTQWHWLQKDWLPGQTWALWQIINTAFILSFFLNVQNIFTGIISVILRKSCKVNQYYYPHIIREGDWETTAKATEWICGWGELDLRTSWLTSHL